MKNYELFTIHEGHETTLLRTNNLKQAKAMYAFMDYCRVRVDGKMLLIHEAERLMYRKRGGRWNSINHGSKSSYKYGAFRQT